jgi:hypothetical protein
MTNPYRLTLEEHPGYLHATAEGKRTPENVRRFLEDAYRACVEKDRSSLLLEMRLSGPTLETTAIFNVISQRATDGAKLRRIAYIDPLTSSMAQARFAETVAVNRGVNVRLFADVETAARWLAGAEQG